VVVTAKLTAPLASVTAGEPPMTAPVGRAERVTDFPIMGLPAVSRMITLAVMGVEPLASAGEPAIEIVERLGLAPMKVTVLGVTPKSELGVAMLSVLTSTIVLLMLPTARPLESETAAGWVRVFPVPVALNVTA
jgi:hypothetical protein